MLKRIVCTIGNAIASKTGNRSAAFIQAWSIARARQFAKVVGVTVGNRQEALRRLALYSRQQVRVALVHEAGNPADQNAVAVIVEVAGSRGYRIGYLARETATILSKALDKMGGVVVATVEEITGGTAGLSAGLKISYEMKGVA